MNVQPAASAVNMVRDREPRAWTLTHRAVDFESALDEGGNRLAR